jgi:hypothetical protein
MGAVAAVIRRNVPANGADDAGCAVLQGAVIKRSLSIPAKCWRFEPGDLIVVVYDLPLTNNAIEFRVWNGVAAASITVR